MNDKYYAAVESALLSHMQRQEERIKELESQPENGLVWACTLYGIPVYCKPEQVGTLTSWLEIKLEFYDFRKVMNDEKRISGWR